MTRLDALAAQDTQLFQCAVCSRELPSLLSLVEQASGALLEVFQRDFSPFSYRSPQFGNALGYPIISYQSAGVCRCCVIVLGFVAGALVGFRLGKALNDELAKAFLLFAQVTHDA